MKNRFIKIAVGVILVGLLVLIYTTAITQTTSINYATSNKVAATAQIDTTDIGAQIEGDPWKELDNLVKAYYPKSGALYQGEMKLFDGNGDNDKLLEEKKFQYTYFNNEYSYSLSPIEVIDKKSYSIIVNHDDKVIAVTHKIKAGKKSNELFDLAAFKKLIEDQSANIKLTQRGDERVLTIDSIQDPNIQGYRIYYSPKTYAINKIFIGMERLFSLGENSDGNPPKEDSKTDEETGGDKSEVESYVYYLEINYLAQKPLSIHQGEFNPESKFVKIEGKKIELTPEYKSYELHNSDQP